MNPDSGRAVMRLARGRLLRIHNGKGRTITAVRGAVWITQENDRRDVLLCAGDHFTLDRSGVALVHALRVTAALAIEDGATVERVGARDSGDGPVPDVSPGSGLYRRALQLRNEALAGFARALWHGLRCAGKNLLHRVGLAAQPCGYAARGG